MTRKWEEIEFLDFKERQLLTRLRKSRLNRIARQDRVKSWKHVKVVGVAVFAVAAAVVGAYLFQERLARLRGDFLEARSRVKASRAEGTVEVSTPTTVWTALKKGETLDGEFSIKTAPASRADLAVFLPGSRISILDETEVSFQPLVIDPEHPDSPGIAIRIDHGSCILHFPKGQPRLDLSLPQKAELQGGGGTFRIDAQPARTTVYVRNGQLRIHDPASEKEDTIASDQQVKVEAGPQWGEPSRFTASFQAFE